MENFHGLNNFKEKIMSHPAQKVFIQSVKDKFKDSFIGKNVLEVGSLNINGTVRDFFENCNYTGIDVGEGLDVDIVCLGQEYRAPDESFDTLISCECFEHNPEWVATFQNMYRMCKPGGLIIMTCATGAREEHGTTRCDPSSSPLSVAINCEYYKNVDQEDFMREFDIQSMFKTFEFSTGNPAHNPTGPHMDLYFYGIK
jgi:SAM-dependent methyltransferase